MSRTATVSSDFFAALARGWRGWSGTQRWGALEQGMSIEATIAGIELVFVLRPDYNPDAWVLRLPFFIAPGESLTHAAREVALLFEQTR